MSFILIIIFIVISQEAKRGIENGIHNSLTLTKNKQVSNHERISRAEPEIVPIDL